MKLPAPHYRESQFGQQDHDQDQGRTDRYLDDEKLARDPRMARINERETSFVRRYIDELPPEALVADIPCGNGRMSQWAVQRGDLRVIGLDLSPAMLKSYRDRLGSSPRCWPVQANATALPLADRSVDLVLNIRLTHHIPDHEVRVQMYRELGRIARGPIVTSFWTTHCWRYVKRRLRGKSIRGFPISPSEFTRSCTDAGLLVRTIEPVRRWREEQCLACCVPA